MDAQWRIGLLGSLRAEQGDQVITRFRSRKAAALLAYLAYYRRPHPRAELIERLWPEGRPKAARTHLRVALTWLQQQLPTAGVPPGSLIVADSAAVQLNPAACVTDVAEFEAALRAAGRAGSPRERAHWLAQAVERYHGELLPGCHEEWILGERRWLAESYFRALGQLLEYLEQEGDFQRALQYAHRGVSADPLREEAQRDLIRLYAAVGQTAAALGQYRELERLLKEQLQALPDPATRALAGEIERLAAIRPQRSICHPLPGAPPEAGSKGTAKRHRPGTHPLDEVRSGETPQPTTPLENEVGRYGAGPLSVPEGENRLITVLFADMTSSLQMTAELSPEEGAVLVNRLLTAMVDMILKYEGRVDHFVGDGVLALFGAPQAHEDDAERAIRAALEIRAGASRLGLEVTAGINTGEVYLGEVGSARYRETTAVGPVVSMAARLQEQAEPGQILVGAATHLQTRRAFEFAPLSLSIRGLTRPAVAYTVERALTRPEKPRGIEGLGAELIGRHQELAKLQEALHEVWHPSTRGPGGGRMVSLIGEAGVGKSRLVRALRDLVSGGGSDSGRGSAPPEVRRRERDSGEPLPRGRRPVSVDPSPLLWLEGRCLELGLSAGYALFVDLFRDYFAWGPEEDERTRGERLAACLWEFVARGDLAEERMEEIGPLLGHLLSIRFGTDWDERLWIKNAGPEEIKYQTFLAVRDFFVALARSQPVILVLEDLHWADSLSLDLIPLLMESLSAAPLLLLCLYRPEPEHKCRHLATIAERKCPERYTELRLRELPPEQSRRLLEALLAVEELPGSVKELILQRSHGNPFFVEEIVRSLISAGLIYQERQVWRARAGIESAAVPESIQSVILSRVDRLRPDLKQVLQGAAVIGRVFRKRLLEQTVGEEIELERALWELEDRALIYRERVVPEVEYSFKHILTQETIYYNILRRHQAGFHQKVAEAIEVLYPDGLEEHCEQLAYHFERSRVNEKAVEYLVRAGERARQAYLNDEAVNYLQRALKRLDAGTADSRNLELRGRMVRELSLAHTALGRTDQSTALLEDQLERCRLGGYPEGEARACYWLSGLLIRANAVQAGSPQAAKVEAVLQRAIELCVRHGLDDWVAKPRLSLAFHHWASRRDLPALERLLLTVRDDLDRLDQQDVQRALTLLMEFQMAQGRWEEARATFTLALAHGGPRPVVFFLLLGEWEERLEREGERGRFVELCREWQAQAQEAGVPGLPNQWFLEAAAPAPVGERPLLDVRFATDPLPPELNWVDPLGVGPPEVRPGYGLILAPPRGLDLWPPANLNAPRLMLRVDGDFVAETRVEIGETGELFTGLLLWESEVDFIRLERRRGQNHGDDIQLEACSSGSFAHVGRGRFPVSGVWLRMERIGGSVRCLCSEDREQWWTCGSVTFPAGKSVEVGMTCVARSPGAAASFQRFTVWKSGDEPAMNGHEPGAA